MASLNHVFLIGNLTKDPEVRYIPSGKAVADLRLAVNRRYKTSSGEDREETCFVDVVVWERQAENAGKYLKKGSSVLVEGRLKFDEWETDGEKRNRLSVIAMRVQFLDRLKRDEFGDAPEDSDGGAGPDNPRGAAGGVKNMGNSGEEAADADDLPF